MYTVIAEFTDSLDGGFRYYAGDQYPRAGYKPAKERIDELLGEDNRRGIALIERPKKTTKPAK